MEQEILVALQRIEAKLDRLEEKPSALIESLRMLSKDMHAAGTRPCATCRMISHVVGESFGCEYYNRRHKQAQESKQCKSAAS